VVTSLTLGNFLKINSYSNHTPEVWHTYTPYYHLSHRDREASKHCHNGWSSSREASI